MRGDRFLPALLLLLLWSVPASAQLLGEGSQTWNSKSANTFGDTVDFRVELDPLDGSASRYLFEGILSTSEDVGSALVATAESDPDFEAVTGLLTNGIDDVIMVHIFFDNGDAVGGGAHEQTFFHLPTADFAGEIITAIHLRIDKLILITPGILGGTDVYAMATVRIMGLGGILLSESSWGGVKSRF